MNSKPLLDHTAMFDSLARLIDNAGLRLMAHAAFNDWPTMERVAAAFLHFVTPWMVIANRNLADDTLRDAFVAYDTGAAQSAEVGHRSFITRIAESAHTLASVRVSVVDEDGLWHVWQYDQPLMEYLAEHKRWAIQVRLRESAVAAGPVMIKLLAYISTTREMQICNLDLASLFEARTVA